LEVVKMKKQNFVSMLMGTIGGILFALGMCMCLLPEWGAFTQGIVVGCVGAAVLLAMFAVRRRMQGKPAIQINGKTIGTAALCVVGTLSMGMGLCMTIVWGGLLMPGIVVGVIGILLLMCVIPLYKGLEN
jgi:uncharacterized membrane protein (UPF0136 family)